jgi:5-formyltetrahydrofolate cyclo-ligase
MSRIGKGAGMYDHELDFMEDYEYTAPSGDGK